MKANEQLVVLDKKLEISKEIAKVRAEMSKQQDKRKVDYITYLYTLKTKYTDKLFDQSMQRLRYIREGKKVKK